MNPLVALALVGSAFTALTALAKNIRKPALLDMLLMPSPATVGEGRARSSQNPSLPNAIITRVARWDDRYQAWIQTPIDPRIVGRLRYQQILAITHGELRNLSRREKHSNRRLLAGFIGLGLAGLAHLTAWPLIPAIFVLAIYSFWPVTMEVFCITV